MNTERERWYPLTVLLFLVGYLSYVLTKGGLLLCLVPTALILWPFPNTKRRVLQALVHRYLGFFTRTWLPFLGIYRIAEISGLERVQAARPVVMVANHRGFMDSIFVLGLVERTGAVGKASHHRTLVYSLLERHFDLVGLDSHSLNSVAASLDRCRAILARGTNLLTFPEGTRARSGRLQRFGRLGFELALANRVPIAPVIIHSTCPFMGNIHGSIFPRSRVVFRIRFLDLEAPQPEDDADSLADRVYRRMADELKQLDAGTCWEVTTSRAPAGERRAHAGPNVA